MAYADAANIATSSGFRNRLVVSMQRRAQQVLADPEADYSSVELARRVVADGWEAAQKLAWQVASHSSVLDPGVEGGDSKATDEQVDEAVSAVWDTIAGITHPAPVEQESTQLKALREIADSIGNTILRRR